MPIKFDTGVTSDVFPSEPMSCEGKPSECSCAFLPSFVAIPTSFLQRIPLNVLRSPCYPSQLSAEVPCDASELLPNADTLGIAPRSCLPGKHALTLAALDLRALALFVLTAFLARERA